MQRSREDFGETRSLPLHLREEDTGAFHDAVGGFLRRELGGLDAEVGEGFVEGLSLVEEAGELGLGVFLAGEEGSVVVVRSAAGEQGGIGIEPDDVAEVAQQGQIPRLGDDAARHLSLNTIVAYDRGLGRAAALRQAMLGLMADRTVPEAADPAIWGAFSLVER